MRTLLSMTPAAALSKPVEKIKPAAPAEQTAGAIPAGAWTSLGLPRLPSLHSLFSWRGAPDQQETERALNQPARTRSRCHNEQRRIDHVSAPKAFEFKDRLKMSR